MLHILKYNPTWKALHGTSVQNVQLFIMRFDGIINKIVFQDGGSDAILNISVVQKTTFMKI